MTVSARGRQATGAAQTTAIAQPPSPPLSVNRRSAPVRFGSIAAKPPLAFPGQAIGLLGGSFNPPHEAHLLISQTAHKRLALDAVWWIVTPGNPLKSHDELADQADRIETCRQLANRAWITVTGFEAQLPSAYTAATLAFLKLRHPNVNFVWLMGADNLRGFHRWQDWKGIADLMPIAVIDRPSHRLKGLASPAAQALRRRFVPESHATRLKSMQPPVWTFLTGPLSTLSSTELRNRRSPVA